MKLLKRMKEEKELLLYCDFHGHSRKKNIFMCNFQKKRILNYSTYYLKKYRWMCW